MQSDEKASEAFWLDRRQDFRHELERTCRVMPADESKTEVDGLTANVSRTGMLVRFPEAMPSEAFPQIGEFARICIDLPASTAYTPRLLECAGQVVRAPAQAGAGTALAFEIHSMKIRSRRGSKTFRKREKSTLVQ